jgi:hypothetical protein
MSILQCPYCCADLRGLFKIAPTVETCGVEWESLGDRMRCKRPKGHTGNHHAEIVTPTVEPAREAGNRHMEPIGEVSLSSPMTVMPSERETPATTGDGGECPCALCRGVKQIYVPQAPLTSSAWRDCPDCHGTGRGGGK